MRIPDRTNRLWPAVLAALQVLWLAGPVHAQPATSVVSVTTDTFVYMDNTESASVDVQPLAQATPTQLRHATLGFDAMRTVEAGEQDEALRQDATSRTDVQRTTVLVNVREPGDLKVTLRAPVDQGVDPRPVAGSASPMAAMSDRGFTWTFAGAGVGLHRFEASIAPNATAEAPDRFVPEVVVERTTTTRSYGEHLRGALMASADVTRTDRLVLEAVLADAGPPTVSVPDLERMDEDDTLPSMTLGTELTFRANGGYAATVSGAVTQTREFGVSELAPYPAVGTIGMSWWDSPVGRKADYDSRPTGTGAWQYSAGTAAVMQPRGGVYRPPQPLYEGDASQASMVATVQPWNDATRRAEPQPGGHMVVDWEGVFADQVTYLTYTDAPGLEPNSTNAWARLQEAPFLQEVGLSSTTAVELRVAGGAIDNREASEPLYGDPLWFEAPEGFVNDFAFAASGGDIPVDFDVELLPEGTKLIPFVRPGEYALEAEPRPDGTQDWTTYVHVSLGYTRSGSDSAAAASGVGEAVTPVSAFSVHVPDGKQYQAAVATPHRRAHLVLGPGEHTIPGSNGSVR